MEGHWDGSEVPPLVLFGIPNTKTETNDLEIAIPHLGSIIVTHEWNGHFEGLSDFPANDRPPVTPVFFAFRIMVGIGFLLLGFVFWGAWVWYKQELMTNRVFLKAASFAWPFGFIAIIAGWMVTEIGRQPWIATGVLRTSAAASPVSADTVMVSLALFVLVYGVIFSTGIYYINRLINVGPAPHVIKPESGMPSRPLSGATDAARQVTRASTA
jgi:cytochrome d ubiquinol oxidase subunit I